VIRQVVTLASYVLLEALRTRFFAIIIILLFTGIGLTLFLGQVAIIETYAIQSSLLAAFLRLAAMYMVSLFVITSTVHEFNDRTIYLLLSLPLPRSVYFIGKFHGFAFVAFFTALTFGSALLSYVPFPAVSLWTLSLFCELLIITALSLWCILTFQHTIQAFSAVVGFYILARSINAMQLMAQGPLNIAPSWIDQLINLLIKLIAMLLPNLERFTQSSWLIYASGSLEILTEIIVQTIIYILFLLTLSLFDLYRKNL
jgi:ABC-type transport system involved in multi-copper enzyme maturation permease subunit